eukprot:5874369-Pyramimonas_sp.AAC.3
MRVKGSTVDVKGYTVDVKGSTVDVKGFTVDVKGSTVAVSNLYLGQSSGNTLAMSSGMVYVSSLAVASDLDQSRERRGDIPSTPTNRMRGGGICPAHQPIAREEGGYTQQTNQL